MSGDDENAFVITETSDGTSLLRCTGTIIAPRLVLSARHCFLKRRSSQAMCNPDGTPVNITLDDSLSVEAPEHIRVLVGSRREVLRPVTVREVVAPIEGSVCISDLAFLVLSEDALDVRMPLRRAPVRLDEKVAVSGWGFTNDDSRALENLPAVRYSREDIPVIGIGPGFFPPGMFAVGGGTVCAADSGSSARIGGAVVGVYSRLEGDLAFCGSELARNVFQGLGSQMVVVERAFEKIGEKPTFIDDVVEDAGPPPGPGDASDGGAPPPPPAPEEGGCAMAPEPSRGARLPMGAGLFGLVVARSARRRRRRSS